jgi:hypothetical protein
MATTKAQQTSADIRKRLATDSKLIHDLWYFIENVSDEDPERTDKFFALRARVRDFYASEA